ncbi:MAG: toll/interleukin-1 receptor domain-containing protein, partial [Opitutaceae bacterium]
MTQAADSAGNTAPGAPRAPSVFLSYATADRAAARALRDALRSAGLDVWHDESELTGGDAWDQKIRRQIRGCDYFMPLISANTE